MKRIKNFTLSIILVAFLITGCNKENKNDIPEIEFSQAVYVCNQGGWNQSNGSLSLYNPLDKTISNDIYFLKNNVTLGDTFQSMIIIDDKIFAVINGSDKITVINAKTFEHITVIEELSSPRFIEFINEDKIYVSHLYSPIITIINPKTYQKISTIKLDYNVEQMIKHGDFLYAAAWNGAKQIFKIDTNKDTIISSLEVSMQPQSIAIDKSNNLWALSDGGWNADFTQKAEIPAITKINLNNFSIEQKMEFEDSNASVSNLCINKTKDTLFYINNNEIFRISILDQNLSNDAFISKDKISAATSLGISPYDYHIYIADPIDYSQNGNIYRFSSKGEKIDEFKSGIIPSFFYFFSEQK